MTQQEIRKNMTNGEWSIDLVSDSDVIIKSIRHTTYAVASLVDKQNEDAVASGYAIISAVNNTYGKGINPESVEKSFNWMDKVEIYLKSKWDEDLTARKLLGGLRELPERRF